MSKSFARIHETNLKKQGILPLTFTDPNSYDKIQSADYIDISGITTIAPQSKLCCTVTYSTQNLFKTTLGLFF